MRLHRSRLVRTRRSVAALDLWLLRRSHQVDSPLADSVLLGASSAANKSKVWFVAAALLAVFGGRRGRRAARRGVLAIGLTSSIVNGPLKFLLRRRRPPANIVARRPNLLVAPASFSFPSGHAASAFAFATSVAAELPPAAAPAFLAASTVGYSRVHTGVHFPGDVVAGAGLGVVAALAAGRILGKGQPLSLPPPERAELPRRVVLLTSPDSGSAGLLDEAKQAMQQCGLEVVDEVPVDRSDELAKWVDQDDRPLIVAAGGDGTIGAAADWIAGTGALLGILPLGTSNDVARSLGIPLEPAQAARTLRDGVPRTIDAGRLKVEDGSARYFVHAATVGFNVRFAQLATKSSIRRRFGRFTYAVAASRALREHEPFECELHYGDQVERLMLAQLSIINAPIFGGSLDLRVPGARVDDRQLIVIAVEERPWWQLLGGAALTVAGVRRHAGGVHAMRVPNLRVHVDRPLDVALDGEISASVPANFEIAAAALRVITPLDPDL
jgi:diacylglycerol kinase family enzyme/membrane-associated phospholipid phosphatase